jgi:CRP/FNR family cyclic AMP-dependent transcriptional regulator
VSTTIDLFRNATDFVTFSAGQVVFNAGDPGDVMYVVIDGEIEIVVNDKVVDTSGAGGIVGEMSLIESTPRMATVRAKTDCKLVPINQKRFLYMVQEAPNFAIKVMRIMSERLRKART